MSQQPVPDKVDGTLAFETMADALHLQKSVIGKKKTKNPKQWLMLFICHR
jgi:hypothetical protein